MLKKLLAPTCLTPSIKAKFALSLAALLFASHVGADSIDLDGWISEGAGDWHLTYNGPLDDPATIAVRATQRLNSSVAVLHSGASDDRGFIYSGSVQVQGTSDDDFLGFVLGYNSGEYASETADYWVIDWKKATQNFNGLFALKGSALSHVTGDLDADFGAAFTHTGPMSTVARGNSLQSNSGWAYRQNYSFDVLYSEQLIEVYIDGFLDMSVSAATAGVSEFGAGSFGFYTLSQEYVDYRDFESAALPSAVPIPAAAWLFGSALLGLGIIKRKRA